MIRFTLFILAMMLTLSLSAQKINQEVTTSNRQPFLIGRVDIDGLNSKSYQSWYRSNHDAYIVDTKTITAIQNELATFKILLFMGTWCGDSKREVPRFIKILEAANFPMENLKIIAVDRRKGYYKKSPTGEEWALSIKRVPTFIFYKDGKEVNRIIESPIISLEKDIESILMNENYIPNYPNSLHFD